MTTRHSRAPEGGRHPAWVALGVELVSFVVGCQPAQPPLAEAPPPRVTVSQPVVREVTDFDDYEGRIAAIPSVDIRARVRGYLTKVSFRDGDRVKSGDVLFEIDKRPYEADLSAARAQKAAGEASLKYARAEYERVRSLQRSGAASREELDLWTGKQAVAQADIQKADAVIESAQLNLDFCTVTAPFAGRVGRAQVDVGNLVNAGGGETLLTTLVNVDPMYVYFDVDERALLRYRRDRRKGESVDTAVPLKDLKIPVFVGLEEEEGYPHKGVLDFADNKVNPSTGTILVRGMLPNESGLLDSGMRARVRVPTSEPRKTLLVTERAVGTDQGLRFIYVVNNQNIAKRRDVKLGRIDHGLQVVLKGLSAEDRVIVNGIQFVRDQTEVDPQPGPMPGTEPSNS